MLSGAGAALLDLAAGSETRLSGAEARHAAVKRLRVGEVVDLVDGHGGRAGAEVVGVSAGEVRLRLVEAPRFEALPALRLTLIQALAKEKRDLQALEAACEIGVQRVIPWGAARAVSRWDSAAKREKGRAKWAALALSALKQSRQSWLARVEEYVESGAEVAGSESGSEPGLQPAARGENSVFAEVKRIVAAGGRVFVLHESATERLSAQLSGVPKETEEIAVVVGPEGGITEAELAAFRAAGAEIALLGPSVLRCSTAGPVALAIIQAALGSW